MAPATQQQRTNRAQPQQTRQDTASTPTIDAAIEATIKQRLTIKQLVERCHQADGVDIDHLEKTIVRSMAIKQLGELLDDEFMREFVMPLMNSPLGFMTDKNPDRPSKKKDAKGNWVYAETRPYSIAQVRRCVIEALLVGARWTDNEFNIISDRCYLAQSFFMRVFRAIPGISNIVEAPGIPVNHNGKTVVRFALSWMLNGEKHQLVDGEGKPGRNFAIIENNGASADNLIGKATRKAYAAAYRQATGSLFVADDPDIEQAVPVVPQGTSKIDALTDRLAVPRDDVRPMEPAKPETSEGELVDQETLSELLTSCAIAEYSGVRLESHLKDTYGVATIGDLTPQQAFDFQQFLDREVERD